MVVCHPGSNDVAKSKDTMVCTDSTRGVEIPARINETVSKRCHVFTEPVHPNEIRPYQNFIPLVLALSLTTAKSGINPVHQKTKDTEK